MAYYNAPVVTRSSDDDDSKPPRRGVGRPPDHSRMSRILDASWTLFVRSGVEATSMAAVAAQARVSKSSLYADFADRAQLFEAAMQQAMVRIETDQGLGTDTGTAQPVRQRLLAFGIGIMSFLASDVGVAFYGTLSAEIRRRPDLSDMFWRNGPGRTRANLAAILTVAAERGEIATDDPAQAADLLFGMWQGFSNLELAVAGGAERVRASVGDRVTSGTDLFLRQHAV